METGSDNSADHELNRREMMGRSLVTGAMALIPGTAVSTNPIRLSAYRKMVPGLAIAVWRHPEQVAHIFSGCPPEIQTAVIEKLREYGAILPDERFTQATCKRLAENNRKERVQERIQRTRRKPAHRLLYEADLMHQPFELYEQKDPTADIINHQIDAIVRSLNQSPKKDRGV